MTRGIPWLYLDSPPMGTDDRPRFRHPVPRESWAESFASLLLELGIVAVIVGACLLVIVLTLWLLTAAVFTP